MQELSPELSAELAAASARAAELRESAGAPKPPGEAELAEIAASGQILERFLADANEALKQIFVAGLAFPDPELTDELASLAERARALSLPTALEHLSRLKVWIAAIALERKTEIRQRYAAGAWEETQRLLAWLRLFRAEYDFLVVQSKMAAEALGLHKRPQETVPLRDASVWPLGIELSEGGKLLFYGLELESKRPVLLHDQLAELSADDPIGGQAISRLFQDVIQLGAALGAVIRLEEHPVIERGRTWIFKPAFKALPKLRAVADTFIPPAPPRLDLDAELASGMRIPQTPSALSLTLCREGSQLSWKTPGGIQAPLPLSPTLLFNMTKLLASKGSKTLPLELVVVPKEEELRVLSLTTDLGERVFPEYDPTLFRLPGHLLAKRAKEAAGRMAPLEGVFLKAAVYLFGGAPVEEMSALGEELSRLRAAGIEALYRRGFARFLLGLPEEAALEPTLRAALTLGALASAKDVAEVEVDLGALGLVLGRSPGEIYAADLRKLDDALIYRALWLTEIAGLAEALEPALLALYEARYRGELKKPSPATVAARALLLGMLELLDEGEAEGEEEAKEEEGEAKESKALSFLEAHLDSLRPKPGKAQKPLPEPIELLQLADTFSFLNHLDRRGATILALGFSKTLFWQLSAEALYSWMVNQEATLGTADTLLLAAGAGLRPFLVL